MVLSVVFAGRVCATEKKVLSYIEKGEKLLEGKRRSYTKAIRYFQTARKIAATLKLNKYFDLRMRLGLATAYTGRRKFKDALSEISGPAKEYGEKNIPRRAYGRGEQRAWVEALIRFSKDVKAGHSGAGLLKELCELADKAGKVLTPYTLKRYAPAAEYLIGCCYERGKKLKTAVDYYLRVVNAHYDNLRDREEREAHRKAKFSAKTPSNVPKSEESPGKLEGDFKTAIDKALAWLQRHQADDGAWLDAKLPDKCSDEPCPPGRVKATANAFGHALAVQAMVRAGIRFTDPEYGPVLKKAVDWILASQTPAGLIATEKVASTMEHAMMTWGLAAVVMAEPEFLKGKGALQKAVNYLLSAQNPHLGWRHGITPGDNDTIHTGLSMIALASAKAAGLNFPKDSYAGGMAWFEKVTDENSGLTGFTSKGDSGGQMVDSMSFLPMDDATALALAARLIFSADCEKEDVIKKGFNILWGNKPRWKENRTIHFRYWHYYSLAYALKKGKDANFCLEKVAKMLVENQEKEGCPEGSWAPLGAFANEGRFASTAQAMLTIINARGVSLPEPADPQELSKKDE
jgi:hypothetical protein